MNPPHRHEHSAHDPAGAHRRTPVLSVRGVSRNYGAVRALVDVDLDIHAREVVAIVGDIGAGKSTLARVMSGALAPDAGHVEIDGAPVSLTSTRVARAQGVAASRCARTSTWCRTCSSARSCAAAACWTSG